MGDFIKKAITTLPSERQLAWQQMEFYAFIHYTVNAFTDREWGLGDESPSVFNPTELDAGQWVGICKSAGMKGMILTCKHHDGFCLWPSKFTEHSIKNSLWKGGQGDLVREVSEACRKEGLKFGIYLSPWDRHEKTYGDSERYNEYFIHQLRELLTGYGEIFCVWFDGACGEGSNGKRQIYDWDRYYRLIRNLQPSAVISVCGPDVRWCGNEAGHCRTSEWSVVPAVLLDAERTAEKSQKEDSGEFARHINSQEEDLGSRQVIERADGLVWYPAEVNTSIRPGWFYHASEDAQVKSTDELLSIYHASVGGNANFLLNIPPDRRGLIHENDAACLCKLGCMLRSIYAKNLADNASAVASECLDADHDAQKMIETNPESYWCPREGTEKAEIEIDMKTAKTFDRIVLKEHIKAMGQRVEHFVLEIRDGDEWKEFYQGTVIGHKKICCAKKIKARYIKLRIIQSRHCPSIESFEVNLGLDE